MKIPLNSLNEEITQLVNYININSSKGFFAHFKCGYYSKIPFCCQLFFVFVWLRLWMFGCFPIIFKVIEWYPPKSMGYNYVPCPVCLLFGRVKELRCCHLDQEYCCNR